MPAPTRPSPGHYLAQRHMPTTSMGDPFAENPIRRSATVVGCSVAVLTAALLAGGDATMLLMISVGWMAMTALIVTVPILIWSLTEEIIRRVRVRIVPHIQELDLSPRVEHILLRHGFLTVRQTHEAEDEALLMLSNMDARGLREIRRAINLWRYRRWQAQGFPTGGMD